MAVGPLVAATLSTTMSVLAGCCTRACGVTRSSSSVPSPTVTLPSANAMGSSWLAGRGNAASGPPALRAPCGPAASPGGARGRSCCLSCASTGTSTVLLLTAPLLSLRSGAGTRRRRPEPRLDPPPIVFSGGCATAWQCNRRRGRALGAPSSGLQGAGGASRAGARRDQVSAGPCPAAAHEIWEQYACSGMQGRA